MPQRPEVPGGEFADAAAFRDLIAQAVEDALKTYQPKLERIHKDSTRPTEVRFQVRQGAKRFHISVELKQGSRTEVQVLFSDQRGQFERFFVKEKLLDPVSEAFAQTVSRLGKHLPG